MKRNATLYVSVILLAYFSLTGCSGNNNDQKGTPADSAIASQATDSSTILSRREHAPEAPYRSLDTFNVATGNAFFDSLYQQYLTSAVLTQDSDICIGDACHSWQTLKDTSTNAVLYFFKGDGYEYGFSNDQYWVVNDTIRFSRSFNVNVEEYPTNTSKTLWRVEEVVYDLRNDINTCIRRTAFSSQMEGFDFALPNVPGAVVPADAKKSPKELQEELKQLLEMKYSPDRD